MKTYLFLAALAVSTIHAVNTKAQYNNLLQKQKPGDIQRLKTQKISKQGIYLEVNGSQGPYGLNTFDKEGRLQSSITPKNRQYFTYDENGRLINWIDSAHDGRRFFKNDYNFSYNPDGSPAQFKIQKNTCVFNYDAAGRQLTETVNGTSNHIYRFNEENKLTEEIYDENGKHIQHKYRYNKYGDLASEIKSATGPDGVDSTVTIFSYDSKGRMLRKQVINTSSVNTSEDPTEPATVTKTNEVHIYTYDVRTGFLITETVTSSVPGKNRKTEWTYDSNGLVIKEANYDAANKPIQVFVYKYY